MDGKAVGLIVVALWDDEATVEEQVPSACRRGSTYRPEVAVRALEHCRARRKIDDPSIRKREWELWCNIFHSGRNCHLSCDLRHWCRCSCCSSMSTLHLAENLKCLSKNIHEALDSQTFQTVDLQLLHT